MLKPSGTAFVVLGDTYYSGKGQPKGGDQKQIWRGVARKKYRAVDKPGLGLPKKSLMGVPWRVALAVRFTLHCRHPAALPRTAAAGPGGDSCTAQK